MFSDNTLLIKTPKVEKINYKQKEFNMRKNFRLLIAFFVVFFIVDRVRIFTTFTQMSLDFAILPFIVEAVYLIVYFILLFYLMYNYHAYEFERNKKALV